MFEWTKEGRRIVWNTELGEHPQSASLCRKHFCELVTEEPGAGNPHAGVCGSGAIASIALRPGEIAGRAKSTG
jgi:hypothetical protein